MQAGTSMWRSLSEQVSAITANNKVITTVMIVGDSDTGKSTLSIYLANMAIKCGLVPTIIDGDIGQGDLAPPAAIGFTLLSKQVVDLRDVKNSQFEFVGSISPTGFESLIAKKLRSILNMIKTISTTNICIVNTDGYVRNGGLQYKAMIAEELQPDAIICLGENVSTFDRQQNKVASWQILHARSSSQAYKSRLERLNRRMDQFLSYIGNRSSIVKLSQVKFDYMGKLFSHFDLYLQLPPIKQLEIDNMKEMFVGIGLEGNIVGFGIILNVDLSHDILYIQTNIDSFDTIYLSNVRLSDG
jgi:polynucleotide 5'-hydroxyl-kinase GRC3/NOL9